MHELKGIFAGIKRGLDYLLMAVGSRFAIGLICMQSFFGRTRMSHDNGIAVRGRIRLMDSLDFPLDDFFVPGRTFASRCRFGGVSYLDDARLVVRGASLKFADAKFESPLDLLMNQGTTTPFRDVKTFMQFMYITLRGRGKNAIWYMKSDPLLYVGCNGPLRRNPESYSLCHYYSKIPYTYRARDGVKRYLKFRFLPADVPPGTPDAGLPDEDDVLDWGWCSQGIRPGETRDRNYLKKELIERLAKQPFRMKLQLQLHDCKEGESVLFQDSTIAWDEKTHPWHDLGIAEFNEVLPYEDWNETQIVIVHRPPSMGWEKCRGMTDPAGMNHMRAMAYWPRRFRIWGNRVFGIPKPIPDERDPAKTVYTPPLPDNRVLDPKPIAIPNKDTRLTSAQRKADLERMRAVYALTVPGNVPTYVKDLPENEKFDPEKQQRMAADMKETIVDLGIAELERVVDGLGDKKNTLELFDSFYPGREIPAVHKRWRRDDEYARQRLAGLHPTLIRRCTELPPHFPVTEADIAGLLPPGATLASEMAAGRVYICDYELLAGLPVAEGCYQTAPICLFHAPAGGHLAPLAIQLGQSPDDGPVFTPKDKPGLWLAVKTFAQSADAAYHEVGAHLLRTHMVQEAIYVCARRNLHTQHPLMELLAPHFIGNMAINHAARQTLLADGGPISKTMAGGYAGTTALLVKSWANFRWDRYEFHNDLKTRGVDDPDLLPGYWYRDDALRVWNTIEVWVRWVITAFYPSVDDLRQDEELRNWIEELADPKRGNIQGLPKIDTAEALVRFVTQVIFNGSAEHSSVNNGQFDYFGYIPNTPGAMLKPPPRTKDDVTEEWLVGALPDWKRASEQIAMVHLLSEPTNHPLGTYDDDFFRDHPHIQKRLAQFHSQLNYVSAAIRTRNVPLEVPYTYLDPRQIAQSVAI